MIQRRQFLQAGAVASSAFVPGLTLAQGKAPEFKFKLGTDLPVTHSVNVRLKEAIAAIQRGEVALVPARRIALSAGLGKDHDCRD